MSFRGEESGSEDGRGDLKKPFLHTGSWYRMGMGSRQSSLMASSASVIRDSSISVVLCTLIVALGPIQFGFTGGYSSPTQDDIIADLGLTLSEVSYPPRTVHNSLPLPTCSLVVRRFLEHWAFLSCTREGLLVLVYGSVVGRIRRWCDLLHSLLPSSPKNLMQSMGNLCGLTPVLLTFHQVPVYIAEISPQNLRGSLGSVNQASSSLCDYGHFNRLSVGYACSLETARSNR
ncbi:hypothetical protein GW17_00047478 [Ensete ventricosum]|nr:hypothetical protein GW17_00047478 [Ensete ventricosum]